MKQICTVYVDTLSLSSDFVWLHSRLLQVSLSLFITAISIPTRKVVCLEKQFQSSLNKQAAQAARLHNLSSYSLFSGTKVCSGTPGPPGREPGSPSPLSAQILMSPSVGARRDTKQRVWRQQAQDTSKCIWISSSIPVTVHINKKQKRRGKITGESFELKEMKRERRVYAKR